MKVIVTGGAGYIGTLLLRALVKKAELVDRTGRMRPIDEIVMFDVNFPADEPVPASSAGPKIRRVTGSVVDAALLKETVKGDAVSVFHLAAVLTGVTERDLTTALQVNVDGTRNVLAALAECGEGSRLVTTSSVTVFTRDAADSPVTDNAAARSSSVYGTTKIISEQLVSAFRIAGRVDGRCARLSTVVIRPKKIGVSAGASISDVLRDVALGRPCDILVEPSTRSGLIDYDSCVNGLIRLHELDAAALEGNPIVNFPALSASIDEMEKAAQESARRRGRTPGPTRKTHNDFAQKTIDAWPTVIDGSRAENLGITCRQSLADICDNFLHDYETFWSARVSA
jgi:nucleoside-diphosphate-sugar epimerase